MHRLSGWRYCYQYNSLETFCSIQAAIDDPQTVNGHILVATAGTYAEILNITKQVELRGPNYGIAGTGSRVSEAIIVPPYEINLSGSPREWSTDPLITIAANNVKIDGFKVDNWYDCGQKEILLQTNALLLNKKKKQTLSKKNMHNCIVIEPVHIGKNTVLKNCIIGPNATIGDNTTIYDSIIRDSIIGQYTKLNDVVLFNSLIGSDSAIWGSSQSLNIGDNTELDLR